MWVGEPGGTLTPGGPVTVALTGPVYVGLAVCSHDANVLETAVFSNVRIEEPPQPIVRSKISIYDLAAKKVEVVYSADQRIEAPNWCPTAPICWSTRWETFGSFPSAKLPPASSASTSACRSAATTTTAFPPTAGC
jgi:hypothetical protein